MGVVKNPKPRKKARQKGKKLSDEELLEKRRELVREAAKLVIEQHRGALKELERH